jgi:hypothetical protein
LEFLGSRTVGKYIFVLYELQSLGYFAKSHKGVETSTVLSILWEFIRNVNSWATPIPLNRNPPVGVSNLVMLMHSGEHHYLQ